MNKKIKTLKKLIDVALPLEDINEASGKEKSIRHGHPSTIHPWWASRSLSAARAVLFAQLVNDPGGNRGWSKGKPKHDVERERERLFNIIRELIKWENSNNEYVIEAAQKEILKSWNETCKINGLDPDSNPLEFIDPFNGRGYLPLEAQRLGLKANSSDLNPIAVMNGKALIEIPIKCVDITPVGPEKYKSDEKSLFGWKGYEGLAEDIKRYGKLIEELAYQKLQNHFPKISIKNRTKKATVLAWLWTRTVPSPNPAAEGSYVPLVSNFAISKVANKEAWIEPIIKKNSYEFIVHKGIIPSSALKGTKTGRGSFKCLLTNSPIPLDYIKEMGKNGKLRKKLLALYVELGESRFFISPTIEQEELADNLKLDWIPMDKLSTHPQYMSPPRYGLTSYGDIYTKRQIAVLDSLCSFLPSVYENAKKNGASNEYALSIITYLGLSISRSSDYWSTLTTWMPRCTVGHVFASHVMPMTWDFPEANPFSTFHCSWEKNTNWIAKVILRSYPKVKRGYVNQKDARVADYKGKIVSTDPPYYDNVPYADISDYFYVWQKRAFRNFYPELFGSIQTPKADELVADTKRHGNDANNYFMDGMTEVMSRIANDSSPYFPVTIYYAFKQSETKEIQTVSRGWEAFLEAVLKAGFQITGTWPIRTERGARSRARGSNALASSIVLVCYKKNRSEPMISRRDFQRELRSNLPESIETMIGGAIGVSPIAPVDLAQSAIGPGIAIFSKYEAVLNQDGSEMSIHDALILINKAITEYLNPDSGNFDSDTLFCNDWFNFYGWSEGLFGEADTLARAKGTSVDGLKESGVLQAGGGKVRLLKWTDYPTVWDPKYDKRLPIWEACHQMIRVLNQQGETEAGELLAKMPEKGEVIRQLAYHLYTQCERKKWAEEARAYNELIGSWHAIVSASQEIDIPGRASQLELDF